MSMFIIYLVLAALYLAAFISTQPAGSVLAYRVGFALGVVGVLMIVLALGRKLPFANLPYVGDYLGWINGPLDLGPLHLAGGIFGFVNWPSGQPGAAFLFTYIGLEFLMLSVGICSDAQWVVLTRRELAAYFYSPIAYIVLVVLTMVGGVAYWLFVLDLLQASQRGLNPMQPPMGVPEPILPHYILNFIPVVSVLVMVPLITMRLLSEEHRSGSLEVLLTAPVRESTVVISKFLAALRFYLLAWYPWGLYLVALRVEGGEAFDYRPLLTFAIVLAVTGAGFVAMGVFFSSLSRNQIVAAILTFVGMCFLFAIYFLKRDRGQTGSGLNDVLTYVSYIDLWIDASYGMFAPRQLLFHLSFAVLCLFLTVKVLESRKWR